MCRDLYIELFGLSMALESEYRSYLPSECFLSIGSGGLPDMACGCKNDQTKQFKQVVFDFRRKISNTTQTGQGKCVVQQE